MATVILLTRDKDYATELFQKISNIQEADKREELKAISQTLVHEVSDCLGAQEDEPSRKNSRISPLQMPSQNFWKDDTLMKRLQGHEDELIKLKKELKKCQTRIVLLEEENSQLINSQGTMANELDKLRHENEDFKTRANIGMIDILEMDLKREKDIVKDLKTRLDDKQNEYASKLQSYEGIFKEYRIKNNELEDYRIKYQKLRGDEVDNNSIAQENRDFQQEYEKYICRFKLIE